MGFKFEQETGQKLATMREIQCQDQAMSKKHLNLVPKKNTLWTDKTKTFSGCVSLNISGVKLGNQILID